MYNGNIYLVWDANGISQKGQNGLDIYFSKSTDGGNTWSQPVITNNDPKGIVREQHDPCIYINPGGDIILGWYDRRNDPNDMLADFYIASHRMGEIVFYKCPSHQGKQILKYPMWAHSILGNTYRCWQQRISLSFSGLMAGTTMETSMFTSVYGVSKLYLLMKSSL